MKKIIIRPRKWGLYPIMKFFYFAFMIGRFLIIPVGIVYLCYLLIKSIFYGC